MLTKGAVTVQAAAGDAYIPRPSACPPDRLRSPRGWPWSEFIEGGHACERTRWLRRAIVQAGQISAGRGCRCARNLSAVGVTGGRWFEPTQLYQINQTLKRTIIRRIF